MLAKTRLRYFIHPILVKWSNLYLGIPPRMNMSSAIKTRNLKATARALAVVLLTEPNTEVKTKEKLKYAQSTRY
jgi:hypothetical protein